MWMISDLIEIGCLCCITISYLTVTTLCLHYDGKSCLWKRMFIPRTIMNQVNETCLNFQPYEC